MSGKSYILAQQSLVRDVRTSRLANKDTTERQINSWIL